MPARASLPIEDFLEAVTAQLDKTQDALRLKAVNRPLTFALKDFSIDLNVFIEMNEQGDILFRPSGPNETGASAVQVGFTTITRPMIEENTVSLELTQRPSLEEVGLRPGERSRLGRLGVRNAAQLRKLEASAGNNTMSRLSGVNLDRLRQALQMGKPRLTQLETGSGEFTPVQSPGDSGIDSNGYDSDTQNPSSIAPGFLHSDQNPDTDSNTARQPAATPPKPTPGNPAIKLRRGERMLRLRGDNLIDGGRLPQARLNDRMLRISSADDRAITLDLPDDLMNQASAGTLEITLPGGEIQNFSVTHEDAASDPETNPDSDPDPWLPGRADS